MLANGRWQTVALAVGDVLVFRGDVQHYGVGYAQLNDRVHAYLVPALHPSPAPTRRRPVV